MDFLSRDEVNRLMHGVTGEFEELKPKAKHSDIVLLEKLIEIANSNVPKQFPKLKGHISVVELQAMLKEKQNEKK